MHSLRRRVENDLNPFLCEDRRDGSANVRFVSMRQQLRVALQNRDGRPEAAEHLSQFQGDVPAPHDQE